MKKFSLFLLPLSFSFFLSSATSSAATGGCCQGPAQYDDYNTGCGLFMDCGGRGSYAQGDQCYCND